MCSTSLHWYELRPNPSLEPWRNGTAPRPRGAKASIKSLAGAARRRTRLSSNVERQVCGRASGMVLLLLRVDGVTIAPTASRRHAARSGNSRWAALRYAVRHDTDPPDVFVGALPTCLPQAGTCCNCITRWASRAISSCDFDE